MAYSDKHRSHLPNHDHVSQAHTDDDYHRLSHSELLTRLRRAEADKTRLLSEHADVMKEVNRKLQVHLLEIRGLKEVNQRLQDDNQELRDLCCFLDDDRQKGRKLAREWQRFGRYTAQVMRSEVTSYQDKLGELEKKQEALLKENMELKRLALFLDDERSGGVTRDDGDGESGSNASGDKQLDSAANRPVELGQPSHLGSQRRTALNEETTSYIRRLESRLAQLQMVNDDEMSTLGSKPEAVVRALRVLDVHEQLEGPRADQNDLDDFEREILREMCTVAWRKLGDKGYPSDGYPDDGAV